MISEEIAEKYFPDEDPIGKVISVNNQYEFTVTGVINDERMDYLEFIARVTSHIPDKGQVMVRHYGFYLIIGTVQAILFVALS